ncbi:MAG: SusC/RagA family TonB-linked outer membrane protein [Cyclobacteriaceae bacterium]|nr:SusC/RagA family TonB-linked outer membrane protein [Cyclobacteriaceae bacterium]
MKKYLLVMLSVLSLSFLMAQERTVTGKVTDAETGEGIPGANVLEKGTTNGAITDLDGNFRLAVSDGATLAFTFVGFVTQEIAIGNRSVIDVAMEQDVQSLSEVVVIGYGVQDKKEITSSVASVKSEDFNKGMVNNPAQLIQGKVAGLTITRPGGDPNGNYTIRLRGVTTVGANAEPLIIIDGVIGGSLSTVDPNDIASIDVLKDGSASAIYGTRGSSGVILVTTKSGKAGKSVVDYNGTVSFDNVARTMKFMTADEYRQVPGMVDLGSDTDWLEQVTQTGVSQIHNISMSGGSGSTTYRASVNVRDVGGIQINTGFSQLNARFNLTQKAMNDRATFSMNLATTTKDASYGFTDVFRYAVLSNPTLPVMFDPTVAGLSDVGGYAERDIFDYWNPVSIANQSINDGKDMRLLGSLRAEYDFSDVVDGLRGTISYSQQRESDMRGQYFMKTAKFQSANLAGGLGGIAQRATEARYNQLFESMLNYDQSFGNTDLALLGGYSYQEFFTEGFGMRGAGFITDAFTYNRIQEAQQFNRGEGSVWSYANSSRLVAFFGRANLNIGGTYFLSASVRQEGSTKFGENNKWGLFPAVSAGVNITNLVNIGGVESLKLRAGWGRTGATPNDSYLSFLRYQGVGSAYVDGSWKPAYGPSSNPNPDLAWETKDELDFGLDFGVMGGKITGTVDWYQRVTSDMLLYVNVPVPPNLVGQTLKNIGELKNTGFELSVNWNVIQTSDFSYTTSVNFSTFSTTIINLDDEGGVLYRANMGSPGQNDTELVRVKEGEKLGQLWGPVMEGVDANGVPIFKDLSGDNSYCNCDDDRTVIGQGLPDFTIGWNNSLTFKSFDFNMFFRSAIGHDLLNSYRGFYENTESTTVSSWNIVNTAAYDPNIKKAVVNSSHVEKASYFKLDNATFGYTLPSKEGAAIRRARIYVSSQNPFVLTNYTGIDPEIRYVDSGENGGQQDPLSPGIERRNTYFTTRTFSMGINLGF